MVNFSCSAKSLGSLVITEGEVTVVEVVVPEAEDAVMVSQG